MKAKVKAELKKLNDCQVASFDTEYVNENRWLMVSTQIRQSFPDGRFTFADLGGGNGVFSDRVLKEFPESRGVLIDNSEYLINLNKHNDRKTVICDSIENSPVYINSVDIIFYNWLLHHLVSRSYASTRQNINQALKMAKRLLSQQGYISIFENMYDGLYFNILPSYLIFYMTSIKLIAPLVSKLGANTAGCGVCFLSKEQWITTLNEVGLVVKGYSDDYSRKFPFYKKFILHLGNVRVGHIWVK